MIAESGKELKKIFIHFNRVRILMGWINRLKKAMYRIIFFFNLSDRASHWNFYALYHWDNILRNRCINMCFGNTRIKTSKRTIRFSERARAIRNVRVSRWVIFFVLFQWNRIQNCRLSKSKRTASWSASCSSLNSLCLVKRKQITGAHRYLCHLLNIQWILCTRGASRDCGEGVSDVN